MLTSYFSIFNEESLQVEGQFISDVKDLISREKEEVKEELEKELGDKLTTVEICEILLVLIYQRKIEVYNDKLTVNKEEKIKISDKYRKYVEYFAETKFPVISSYGLSGINDLGLDLLRANVFLLFDGTRTDDYIVEILKAKHARDEIKVDNTDSKAVETILKEYVATMRTIIEENFLNK